MPVSDWHVQRQYYQDTKKGGRIHMDEATYMYRINSICLKKGEPFERYVGIYNRNTYTYYYLK